MHMYDDKYEAACAALAACYALYYNKKGKTMPIVTIKGVKYLLRWTTEQKQLIKKVGDKYKTGKKVSWSLAEHEGALKTLPKVSYSAFSAQYALLTKKVKTKQKTKSVKRTNKERRIKYYSKIKSIDKRRSWTIDPPRICKKVHY